jgi:streptogramin lyase
MRRYPPLAFPLMPQVRPADRIGSGPPDLAGRLAGQRRQAETLATINLSTGPQWSYSLKTFPRPTGKGTQVIYTSYELSPPTRQPHDVIVDSNGMAWYASFGEQVLAKLDPDTGKLTEYEIPLLKPGLPTGVLAIAFDRAENVWMAMQFQGGVAKFDPVTEAFETWRVPEELDGDYVQITQLSPHNTHVDNKVWMVDAGTYTVLRLDTATGEFEVFPPFEIPRPNIYAVFSDKANNAYFTVMGREHIGFIDAQTGEIELHETPTPQSAPRRGMVAPDGRVWFGENRRNRIGMFDPETRQIKEWEAPTPFSNPYDATIDRNGDVWAGGEFSDRILRLDPQTGEFIEYGLPGFVNVRRVFVDNRAEPVAFWVGANHTASIIKLEPLDTAGSMQ